MANSILDEIRVLKQEHPALRIFTSTNGVLVDSQAKRQAALAMDRVYFSIDGCDQETAQRYQVGTDFTAAYEYLCALVRERDQAGADTGPIIEWKYVVFRWNDRAEHIERALQLARRAKVDGISFWQTLNPVHGISTRFFTAAHFRAMEQHPKIRFVPLTARGQGLYDGRA
jgi:wyosine [tRNA(Phe)-imidazoG37] synthetase (radical SAM superfamily)